jgi:hypothetical protein
MKTRSLLAVMLLALVVSAAGCAARSASTKVTPPARPDTSSASIEPAPDPLVLVETGYVVAPLNEGLMVSYGFVLRNPNVHAGALSTTVRITMRDAQGRVVGTEDSVVPRIMPGATVAWGGEGADPHLKKPAQVDFEVLDPGVNWRAAAQMEPPDFKPLTVTGAKAGKPGALTTSFTGQLANPNAVGFKEVGLGILLRDKSGKILWVLPGSAEKVPASASVPFRVDIMDLERYASFKIYPQPW